MSRASSDDRELYKSYETWKGWVQTFAFAKDDAHYFAGETRDCKIRDADVLEIGFGAGQFLAWAREQGARVSGTEINSTLLKAAEGYGVTLLPSAIEQVAEVHRRAFDTIVAFDVFEHFSLGEIVEKLKAVEIMLRSGGHLILRFPNAQSPFGLAPQFGDPTHKSALSRSLFEQLLQGRSLTIQRYACAYRIASGGLVRGLVRRLRYLGRDTLAAVLNGIYAQNIPWDPVVVLVLRNNVEAHSADGQDKTMARKA